jgi:uncharacterized lipoprotein
MKLNWTAILAVAALSSGCAYTPQAVVISPKVDERASQMGADHAVNLNVIDERPRQTLGTRGIRGIGGADLTIEGHLWAIVQKALAEGLANLNFMPLLDSNPEGRELRVEIRNLDYTVTQGLWGGTLRVGASLKAICVRGGQRPYEQLHRGEVVESVQVVQTAEVNNSYVSQAVSAAVNSLLRDQELLTCLRSDGKI